jgi:Cu(I)/Ag(I) efflux system membrane fusion protein
MFADVAVEVPLGPRLAVPDSALLLSGEHRYVFVDRGGGRLEAVEVQVGAQAGDYDEIRGGLSAGDRVATEATFLLSSEAKLRDALPRWKAP